MSTTKSVVSTTAPIKGPKARAVAPAADSGVTMQDGRYALPTSVRIELPNGYKPTAKEEYMSPRQLEYFRRKLSKWREELVEESRQTIESLRDEVRDVGDEPSARRARPKIRSSCARATAIASSSRRSTRRSSASRKAVTASARRPTRKSGLDRLEARPIATLSLDAQERWEHRQKRWATDRKSRNSGFGNRDEHAVALHPAVHPESRIPNSGSFMTSRKYFGTDGIRGPRRRMADHRRVLAQARSRGRQGSRGQQRQGRRRDRQGHARLGLHVRVGARSGSRRGGLRLCGCWARCRHPRSPTSRAAFAPTRAS